MTKHYKPMTGSQARILHHLSELLEEAGTPDTKARAAGIRGRLAQTPRISHTAAARLATNAALYLTTTKPEKSTP